MTYPMTLYLGMNWIQVDMNVVYKQKGVGPLLSSRPWYTQANLVKPVQKGTHPLLGGTPTCSLCRLRLNIACFYSEKSRTQPGFNVNKIYK